VNRWGEGFGIKGLGFGCVLGTVPGLAALTTPPPLLMYRMMGVSGSIA